MPAHKTLAFMMDPIGSIDIDADTTFVMMLEAQRRGHRVVYLEQRDLGLSDGHVVARVRPVTLRREKGRHADLGEPRSVVLDDDVDALFQRKDPPVDDEYVAATQILSLCRRTCVINRPEGILAANEKLYAQHFADLMPETIDGRSLEVAGRTVTLATNGAPVETITMTAKQRFLSVLSHPTVVYLLMLLGFYGLFFELSTPGAILPGVIGGIAIILAAYALHLMPVNWAGLALMALALGREVRIAHSERAQSQLLSRSAARRR